MKTILHVNRHTLAQNKKHNANKPPITIKTSKSNSYGHSVDILDKNGEVVATLVHSKKPLSCGARVFIVTHNDVKIRKRYGSRNDSHMGRGCTTRSCNMVKTKVKTMVR